MLSLDPEREAAFTARVKDSSEAQIRAEGGGVNKSLPRITLDELRLRSADSIADRALVLHILVKVSFGMHPSRGLEWLTSQGAVHAASPRELGLLSMDTPLDGETRNRARWNIEALWAVAWVGGFIAELGPTQPIGDELASLFPTSQSPKESYDFRKRFALRTLKDIYSTLDLFYRAHWYVRDCQLTGKDPVPFNAGVVHERRQLLEWVVHEEDSWDHVELST